MKKGVLFLALIFLIGLFGGCVDNDDLKDTITSGTWRVGYYSDAGDDETWRFSGYVFTFLADGKITVTRPALASAPGTWNEYNNDARLELDFGNAGALGRLNEDWAVNRIEGDEVLLDKFLAPTKQLRFDKL